jgi:hypothetical protein
MTQGSRTREPNWDDPGFCKAATAHFRTLVDGLKSCNQALARGEREHEDNRLDEATTALQHVIAFLHDAYPPSRDMHLVRPLSHMYMAIHARRRGAHPAMFDRPIPDERPEGSNQPVPRKPTNVPGDDVTGHLAAAVELLRRGGHGAGKGAEKIAALCRAEDVKTASGQIIMPTQLAQRLKDIRRKRAPATAIESFENVLKLYNSALSDPRIDKRRYTEAAARAIVKNVGCLAAREAPDRHRLAEKK